ncbi:MAG: isochorismate synthase [Microcystaceae cyanobacterium]
MFKSLQNLVQYITEGFARIFSPSDDEYPEVGVQPFDSEPYAPSESET